MNKILFVFIASFLIDELPSHISASQKTKKTLIKTTPWPLVPGLQGNSIRNLNFFINQFSGCLIHVFNYHGIEILQIDHPIVLSRFDIYETTDTNNSKRRTLVHRVPIEKVPSKGFLFPNQSQTYQTPPTKKVFVIDRSTKARWTCQAKFDLFPLEFKDIPNYYKYGSYWLKRHGPFESLNFGPFAYDYDKEKQLPQRCKRIVSIAILAIIIHTKIKYA